ncbi:hypothetical protein [Streptomyces albospinus]|uniref:hypothetical protein n=1 Tax=Streptomyces albospinus TaxID=285515 RepID=UPI001E4732D7|nr:hypothetical protein [Streptomyces albospinus]
MVGLLRCGQDGRAHPHAHRVVVGTGHHGNDTDQGQLCLSAAGSLGGDHPSLVVWKTSAPHHWAKQS